MSTRELQKIAVVGANGRQGSSTIDALVAKGFHVVGIVRKEKNKESVEAKGENVKAVLGDFNNAESLTKAFEGVDGLYLYFPLNFDTNSALRQLNNVMTAAKAQNVKFIVYSNGYIVRPGSGLSAFEKAIEAENNLLSQFRGCILKPTAFIDDILNGANGESFKAYNSSFHSIYDLDQMGGYISTRDIGCVAANIFENPEPYVGRKIDLASDAITGREALAVVSKLRGVQLKYSVIPWPLVVRLFLPQLVAFWRSIDVSVLRAAAANVREIHPDFWTLEKFLEARGFAALTLQDEPAYSCLMS